MYSSVHDHFLPFLPHSPPKLPQPSSLYLRQPNLQIIQLVECSPPPKEHAPSFPSDSDSYSSSYDDDDDDEDEVMDEDEDGDEDEDEEPCSSYCSSDDADPQLPIAPSAPLDDTFRLRMHRVQAWRDAILDRSRHPASASTPCPPSTPNSQKRKADADASHTLSTPRKHARSTHSLGALSCPACDADFASPQGLRMHGRAGSSENDACRVAVEYGFE